MKTPGFGVVFGLLVAALVLVPVGPAAAQDFLGRWKVVRIFTTLDQERDNGNRMLHPVTQSQPGSPRIEGLLVPQDLVVEFVILPGSKAQHVTLTYQGLLLLSLNWTLRHIPTPPADPEPPSLKVWSEENATFDTYEMLYNDATTLVFSDHGSPGSRFLDIYQLEREP